MLARNPPSVAKPWAWVIFLVCTAASADAALSQEIWKYHCDLSGNFTFDIVIDRSTDAVSDNGRVFINGENLNECTARVTWELQRIIWGHACSDGTTITDSLEYASGIYRHHARGPVVLSDNIAYCQPASRGEKLFPFGWFHRIFVH
jgi:hypothetical protein